jgi:hypothetical protein
VESIELPTRKVSGKDRLILGALLSGSALVLLENLAALFHLRPPFALLAVVALTLAAVLMLVSSNHKRATTLYPKERAVVVTSTVLGRWRRSRRIDLSECTWVRAKGDRGKAIPCVRVQAGTPGYKTVQLMAIPGTSPKEVTAALEWCARIADAMQVENKGYREVW